MGGLFMIKKRVFVCTIILICIFVIIGYIYLSILRKDLILCPFRNLTGLYCPGCGNTRLAENFLKGHPLKALSYNYYFPAEAFYILWVLFSQLNSKLKTGKFSYNSPCKAVDYLVLIGLIVWWVLRNILKI